MEDLHLLSSRQLAWRTPLRVNRDRTESDRTGLMAYERMLHSEGLLESPRAFTEKRKPVWKGR